MKIGIIFIATGKYYRFAQGLVESFEEYFLNNHTKEYYIFTDNESPSFLRSNVKYIKKLKEEWPYDSLRRFKSIYENRDEFKNLDYLFFCNANMKAVDYVNEEIIPKDDVKFSAVVHPGYYLDSVNTLPYERNPNSLAYIPGGSGKHYYQGCFYGGRSDSFIEMCRVLSNNVEIDLERGIIASVNDESHTNRYFLDVSVLPINPTYSYPEQVLSSEAEYSDCPSYVDLSRKKPKIIQLDKRKFGGHDYLRETN